MSQTGPSDGRAFPETHWSQIIRAHDVDDPEHRQHLDTLLRRYWKPAYHFIRAVRSLSPADAEDLTQGFFAMVLTRVDFAALSPERGSFRGFLKTALRRFVISSERRQSVQRDRRAVPLFPFAEAEAELAAAGGEPAGVDPDDTFDRAFAREVLAEMMTQLEAELEREGKQIYLTVFRAYCAGEDQELSYDDVARAHGLKADDVRNYLRVVRQRGRTLLKSVVRAYLLPGESLDGELAFLLADPGPRRRR